MMARWPLLLKNQSPFILRRSQLGKSSYSKLDSKWMNFYFILILLLAFGKLCNVMNPSTDLYVLFFSCVRFFAEVPAAARGPVDVIESPYDSEMEDSQSDNVLLKIRGSYYLLLNSTVIERSIIKARLVILFAFKNHEELRMTISGFEGYCRGEIIL